MSLFENLVPMDAKWVRTDVEKEITNLDTFVTEGAFGLQVYGIPLLATLDIEPWTRVHTVHIIQLKKQVRRRIGTAIDWTDAVPEEVIYRVDRVNNYNLRDYED